MITVIGHEEPNEFETLSTSHATVIGLTWNSYAHVGLRL